MRRVIGPALLGLVCGCYLFGDEPKARKLDGAKAEAKTATSTGAEISEPTLPVAEPANSECPEVLSGAETEARAIPSSCASVRVRGQYLIDGTSLTVAAGVELRFEPGAVLEVGRDRAGVLKLEGSPEQPVRLVADSVSDSGRWQGLRLHAQAGGSSLRNVEISGASSEDRAVLWIATAEVTAEQLKIRSLGGRALELASDAAPALLGVELAGTGPVVRASPGAIAGLQDAKLEPGAWIELTPGTVHGVVEWPPQIYRLDGVVRIEGEADRPAQLSLSAGTELRFGPDARMVIGGLTPGSLVANAQPPGVPGAPPGLTPPGPTPPSGGGAIRLIAAEGTLPGSWAGLLVQERGTLWLRNVELAHGGARDEGVIVAESGASLNLEGCSLRSNLVGVELRGVGVEVEGFDGCEFVETPVAVRTNPALLAAVGPANRFDAEARVEVERGKIEADASWAALAAPIVIRGDLFVDKGATLTVAPGSRLAFEPGVILGVGYYQQASVDLRGTAEAPIVLEAASSSWGGVVLGSHTQKARFEHVELRNASNPAAIELRDGADATLVNVSGSACAGAVVKWDCESTVGNIGIRASDGTPTELLAPSNCK